MAMAPIVNSAVRATTNPNNVFHSMGDRRSILRGVTSLAILADCAASPKKSWPGESYDLRASFKTRLQAYISIGRERPWVDSSGGSRGLYVLCVHACPVRHVHDVLFVP